MSRYGYIKHSELAHHGIKGQKWGVRRYQNEDGSLTEAGKKRYLNSNGYLKGNAYTDKYPGRKFGTVEGLDINKYNKYESERKAKESNSIKSKFKNYDTKINKIVNNILKDEEYDDEHWDYGMYDHIENVFGKKLEDFSDNELSQIIDNIYDEHRRKVKN